MPHPDFARPSPALCRVEHVRTLFANNGQCSGGAAAVVFAGIAQELMILAPRGLRGAALLQSIQAMS